MSDRTSGVIISPIRTGHVLRASRIRQCGQVQTICAGPAKNGLARLLACLESLLERPLLIVSPGIGQQPAGEARTSTDSCTQGGVPGPPATGLQEQVANHRKRRGSKARVVSVTEKAPRGVR